jgi:hypothetical protein
MDLGCARSFGHLHKFGYLGQGYSLHHFCRRSDGPEDRRPEVVRRRNLLTPSVELGMSVNDATPDWRDHRSEAGRRRRDPPNVVIGPADRVRRQL